MLPCIVITYIYVHFSFLFFSLCLVLVVKCTLCGGVARGGGGPGVPVTPLGRPSFEQTTYNIQVAKTP